MHRDQCAQQQQRHHGGAAMRHQQVSRGLLPYLVAGNILLPIHHEPAAARQEQNRESGIDRIAK